MPPTTTPPPHSDPALERLITFLSPKTVAAYAQTRADWALRILQIVMKRVAERWHAAGTGPFRSCKEVTGALRAVVEEMRVEQVAGENEIGAGDVRRVLGVVGRAAGADWGRDGEVGREFISGKQKQTAPRLQFEVHPNQAAPNALHVPWPEDVEEHAEMLRKALGRLRGCEPARQDAVVVPLMELKILGDCVAQLNRKIGRNRAKLGDNATPGHLMQGGNEGTGARLVELGRSEQTTAALEQNFPQKHNLPRSRGTSPVKKKARGVPVDDTNQTSKASTQNDGAYQLFVLAEREQVMNDIKKHQKNSPGITGQDLTNLLAELWNTMLPDEKTPFEAAAQELNDQRSESQRSAPGLDKWYGIDVAARTVTQQDSIQGMTRCNTVLNARSIYQSMLSKKRNAPPANPAINIPAAAAAAYIPMVSNASPQPPPAIPPIQSPPSLGPPQHKETSLPFRSYPSSRSLSGTRAPLQNVSNKFARQAQRFSLHTSTSSKQAPSYAQMHAQMKRFNDEMERDADRDRMRGKDAPVVDLTGEEVEGGRDENVDPEVGGRG